MHPDAKTDIWLTPDTMAETENARPATIDVDAAGPATRRDSILPSAESYTSKPSRQTCRSTHVAAISDTKQYWLVLGSVDGIFDQS
jgi:hypothetical protein